MARDHSPQERQRQHLARKRASRAGYDRILIVSEGSKTEPNYFNELRQFYRLHTASVQVRHSEIGTAPIQVVKYGEQLFKFGDQHKKIQPRAFERVYAVFDRDEHPSYLDALNLAASLDRKLRNDNKQMARFQAIASIPSFELWLLLHFEDIQAPIHRDEVLRRLKSHIVGYDKGASQTFSVTRGRLDLATQRAKTLATKFNAKSAPEPYTDVMTLVELLINLS